MKPALKAIPLLSWFDKNTLLHLRFPFSFFLMPVFLFALSQSDHIETHTAITGFIILHFLLFPSVNGYNSYQDRDETSIGGIKHPPRVTEKLFYATLLMDVLSVLAGFLISIAFSGLLLLFIIMSRLYSYRRIRLKKYPFIAFLIVFIFQGGYVFLMSAESIQPGSIPGFFVRENLICMMISSLFIGSMYPLTQIYQHEADKRDGVISLSYKLGYKGTFIFSALLFTIAVIILFLYLHSQKQVNMLMLFLIFMLPVILRLSRWFRKVKENPVHANYENTMALNLISSVCMNTYFLLLFIHNQIFF